MYGYCRLAILLLAPLLFSQAAWAKPAILDIRLGIHPGSTRIVVELSEPAAYRVGLLAGPPRLYIELSESDWQGPRLPGVVGQIRSLAMTTNGGITRLTADLRGNAKIGSVTLIAGSAGGQTRRLVVDLLPAAATEFSAAVMAPPIDSNPPLVVSSMASAVPVAPVPTKPWPAVSTPATPASLTTYADNAAIPLLKPAAAVDILPAGTGATAPSTIPVR